MRVRDIGRAALAGLALCWPSLLFAQVGEPKARDGWEAFTNVKFQGGEASIPPKSTGMLVLTDSTLAFHHCINSYCGEVKGKPPFKEPPMWSIRIDKIAEIASNQTIGTNGFGLLQVDDLVTITYATEASVSAPVFKTQKAQSAAIIAKVKFRQRKLKMARDSSDKR